MSHKDLRKNIFRKLWMNSSEMFSKRITFCYLSLCMNAGLDRLLKTRCYGSKYSVLRTNHLYSLLVRLYTHRFEHYHHWQVLHNRSHIRTSCPEKKSSQYSRHNFDKFRHSFVIFGTNHPDTSAY